MNTAVRSTQLCLEACALGHEAIKIAFKVNEMPVDDSRRWGLSQRMFAIYKRINEITEEIKSETRALS